MDANVQQRAVAETLPIQGETLGADMLDLIPAHTNTTTPDLIQIGPSKANPPHNPPIFWLHHRRRQTHHYHPLQIGHKPHPTTSRSPSESTLSPMGGGSRASTDVLVARMVLQSRQQVRARTPTAMERISTTPTSPTTIGAIGDRDPSGHRQHGRLRVGGRRGESPETTGLGRKCGCFALAPNRSKLPRKWRRRASPRICGGRNFTIPSRSGRSVVCSAQSHTTQKWLSWPRVTRPRRISRILGPDELAKVAEIATAAVTSLSSVRGNCAAFAAMVAGRASGTRPTRREEAKVAAACVYDVTVQAPSEHLQARCVTHLCYTSK